MLSLTTMFVGICTDVYSVLTYIGYNLMLCLTGVLFVS